MALIELAPQTRRRSGSDTPGRWRALILPGSIVIFLVLALWLANTKAPWCDGSSGCEPRLRSGFYGRMVRPEPSGHDLNAYLRGVQERTYIFPPNHLVALAGWLRLFGFSAFITRVYSVCWSAIGLAALFYVLLRLFPDRRVAQLAVLLAAIDFIFLWSTADGRPEAVANSLAICSVAAYLHFREANLGRPFCASQIFGCCGRLRAFQRFADRALTGGCRRYLDRKRLRLQYVLWAAAPYAFFGLLWFFYILQKPSDFVAQFFPQAGYSERWKGFLRPDIAIGTEIDRHLAAYCIDDLWAGVTNGGVYRTAPASSALSGSCEPGGTWSERSAPFWSLPPC